MNGEPIVMHKVREALPFLGAKSQDTICAPLPTCPPINIAELAEDPIQTDEVDPQR